MSALRTHKLKKAAEEVARVNAEHAAKLAQIKQQVVTDNELPKGFLLKHWKDGFSLDNVRITERQAELLNNIGFPIWYQGNERMPK